VARDLRNASGFDRDEVVEQFDGFFSLEPIDVAGYRRAGLPVDVALGPEAVQKLRTTKQADVLMIGALFPEWFTAASLRGNFDYYEPITAHGSSLSPPVHALLASWLRDEGRCLAFLRESANIDIAENFRNAADGVHIGSLGGLWQAIVFGLGGYRFTSTEVTLNPFLPRGIDRLAFPVRWRGRVMHVEIQQGGELAVQLVFGGPCAVRVNGERRIVEPGTTQVVMFEAEWTPWTEAAAEKGAHRA
jgi:kojibiose phosphorylase